MRLTPKVSLDPALSSAEALQPVTTQLRSWSLERKTAPCDFFGKNLLEAGGRSEGENCLAETFLQETRFVILLCSCWSILLFL